MKKILMTVFLSMVAIVPRSYSKIQNKMQDKSPWVYFDLGDTVISTKDFKHLHYFKGAREYMDELKRQGYKIGIITNIPETWGMDYDQKLQTLKKFIHDGWDEDRPFDWSVYDEVILPLSNNEMKPALTLFLKAMNRAATCPSAYIGESPKEIVAAESVGMAVKLFVESDPELYVPVEKMATYLKSNYHREYDRDCFLE